MMLKPMMNNEDDYTYILIKGRDNIYNFYRYHSGSSFNFKVYKSYSTRTGQEVIMAIPTHQYGLHSEYLKTISTIKDPT